RRRHTRSKRDWSSDVCSSDLAAMGSGHAFPIQSHHPRGLLPPMLQAIETEVGDAGCVGNAGDADDAAHFAVNLPCVGIRSRNIPVGRASCRERVYISMEEQ